MKGTAATGTATRARTVPRRVIVINPRTHKVVWQYGHTGVPGRAPGYLDDPDGVDLVPPDSMLIRR
ncbi:MAG TPA: hypothetical protein VN695_18405 [Streptosporangiaceae bacterium]|nr:hypothetical protein [Streptosporangiaceae bacterium]